MIRLLLLLPLLLITAHDLVGQSTPRPAKTLLWRIEGKGMKEPSYLYGTMHVRDRRAFDLADSVLVAFGRCKAFAAELQLDSAMTWFLRQMFSPDSTEELVALDDDGEDGYPRNDGSRRRVPRWMKQMMDAREDADEEKTEPSDGRETFLDAWLFRLAKLEQKEVIGIETVREQAHVFDGTSLEEEAMEAAADRGEEEGRLLYERMVRTYRQGDLDELLAIIYESGMSDEYFDRLLTHRNHVMAERIDPLIRQRSTFIAVGAGHLPGEDGLLTLLRARGFEVEPVAVTRTGLARSYHEPDRLLPWFHLDDTAHGFRLDLPLEPVDLPWSQFAENGPLGRLSPDSRMMMTMDISTMTAYFTATFELPPGYLMVDRDGAVDAMLERFGSGSLARMVSRKHVAMDGAEGYDLAVSEEGMQMRTLVLTRGHKLHLLLAVGVASPTGNRDLERFVSSFSLPPLPQYDWTTVSDPTGGFTVEMPGEIRRQITDDDDSYRLLHIQSGAVAGDDLAGGTSYIVAWGDQSPLGSSYLYGDSNLIAWGIAQLAERLGAESNEPTGVTFDGRRGTEVMLTHESGSSYRVRLIMRGNRIYWLLAGGADDAVTDDDADRFFDSFRFLQPPTTEWQRHTFDSLGFTVMLPAEPSIRDYRAQERYSSPTGTLQIIASDSNSGSGYMVVARSYSGYARKSSIDSVLIDETGYLGENDSLAEIRTLSIDGRPAREVVVPVEGSGRVRRIRVLLDGATVYRMEAIVPVDELRSERTDRFFTSLALLDSTRGDLFTDKFALLLNDLQSSDTTRSGNAASALGWFVPEANERPLLYSTLRRLYRKRADSLDGARRDLLSLLAEDSSGVDLIRELLPAIPAEEQQAAAEVLVSINTPASLHLLADVLLARRDDLETWKEYLLYPLPYEPAATGVMYPRILSLLDLPNQTAQILGLTASALDSGALDVKVITAYEVRLRQLMQDALEEEGTVTVEYEEDPDAWSEASSRIWRRSSILQDGARTLAWFPRNDSTVRLLRELLREDDDDIRREALLALMRLDEDVPDYIFSRLLAKPLDRLAMYRTLDRAGMLEKFPVVYRTQEKIAEGLAMEWLYDDEAAPEAIRFVEEREMPDGRYFVFRFHYGEEEEIWLAAVIGPQPPDSTQIDTTYASGVSNYDRLDAMSIEEHIRAQVERRRGRR